MYIKVKAQKLDLTYVTCTDLIHADPGPSIVVYSAGDFQTGNNGETLPDPYTFAVIGYEYDVPNEEYDLFWFPGVSIDSVTVTAQPPSDPVNGLAFPSSGITDSNGEFDTVVTLPIATQLPCYVDIEAASNDPVIPDIDAFKTQYGTATVIPDRELKLFLDVDDSWSVDHQDDSPSFIPGSNPITRKNSTRKSKQISTGPLFNPKTEPLPRPTIRMSGGEPAQDGDLECPVENQGKKIKGESLPVPPDEETPIHTVKLIAAFFDKDGILVDPPAGVSTVRISLEETTAFKGIAMNFWSNTDPDYKLGYGVQEVVVSFSGSPGAAQVDLGVYDYGGRTRVRASINEWYDIADYGEKTVVLPVDGDDNNLPPYCGYLAEGYFIDTINQDQSIDADAYPVSLYPEGGNINWGLVGDGYSFYEEYRGFVSIGAHIRTNPQVKDLFINKYKVGRPQISDDDISLVGLGYVHTGGLNVHEVFNDQDIRYQDLWECKAYQGVNYNYTNSNTSQPGSTPGHHLQKPIRVVYGVSKDFKNVGFDPGTFAGTLTYSDEPDIPNRTHYCVIATDMIQDMKPSSGHFHTNSQWRLNAYRSIISHEVFHGMHVCHQKPSPEDCPDGAVVVPKPVLHITSDFYIMHSGVIGWLNNKSNNPAGIQPPSVYHENSVRQIRLHDNDQEVKQ